MLGLTCSWVNGCDTWSQKNQVKAFWFHKLRAVIVKTEHEAGKYRANAAGSTDYDYFCVSWDLVDVQNHSTILDVFPSAPRMPVQLVLRLQHRRRTTAAGARKGTDGRASSEQRHRKEQWLWLTCPSTSVE